MILIDFSQVFLAATFSFSEDFKKGNDTNKMKDILRHVLFTSLLQYKKTFRKYGGMVLCLGGRKPDVWVDGARVCRVGDKDPDSPPDIITSGSTDVFVN